MIYNNSPTHNLPALTENRAVHQFNNGNILLTNGREKQFPTVNTVHDPIQAAHDDAILPMRFQFDFSLFSNLKHTHSNKNVRKGPKIILCKSNHLKKNAKFG